MSEAKKLKWYRKYELLFVVALSLLYIGLVVVSINRSSVWHDEGYTAVLIENDYAGIVERTAMDVHPPLYYLALKTWSLVLGDAVFTLRIFSAVCMLGAILIIWHIVRKIYGRRAGLAALTLMSIGPFLVRYGQEMRMYGLAALLASLATLVYLSIYNKTKSSAWRFVAYGLIVVAGMYTQYFFVLVPAVHLIHYLFASGESSFKRRFIKLRPFLISAVVIALIFAPWLPTVKNQFSEVHGSFWIPKVSIETLTSTPVAMTIMKKQYQMTGAYALIAIFALVVLIVLFRKFLLTYKDSPSRLLFLSIVGPPLLLFLLSLPPFQPSYQDRYMSFMAPIFYSVIALSIIAFNSRRSRLIAGLAAVAVLAVGQVNNFIEGNNHGWSPAPYFTMNSILDRVTTDDPIYSTSLWTFFDAHIAAEDRGMENNTQVLFEEYPTRWMGNWSAIYDRPDLITTSIPGETEQFWLIDESGTPQYYGQSLEGFVAGETYTSGYAKITKYTKE